MYTKLLDKQTKLALIGLGYVGLPIAMEFAKHVSVIGFDINEDRLDKLRNCIDPCGELPTEVFEHKDITFTSSIEKLREASFYVIAVPTPIDSHNEPDLSPLLGATRTVGKVLKRGDYVVYESTVYPGCTEEDCIPILEEVSGLRVGEDFKVGYSPERINPGDKVHTLVNTVKIVSGCDAEALETISEVYKLVVQAGLHRAPSIKVAEAAKIIENTQHAGQFLFGGCECICELIQFIERMSMDVSECLNSFSELCGQILLDLRNFGNVFCVVQQMRMKGSHVVDYLLNGVPILVLAGASE